jgi:hypothetical protein
MGIPFVNAEQVYYCSSELNVGIIKDKKTGKWKKGNFKEERYTIKFNDDYTIIKGLSAADFLCFKSYGESNLFCYQQLYSGQVFMFNKDNLRFSLLQGSPFGYLVASDPLPDTNNYYVGTCEKF